MDFLLLPTIMKACEIYNQKKVKAQILEVAAGES